MLIRTLTIIELTTYRLLLQSLRQSRVLIVNLYQRLPLNSRLVSRIIIVRVVKLLLKPRIVSRILTLLVVKLLLSSRIVFRILLLSRVILSKKRLLVNKVSSKSYSYSIINSTYRISLQSLVEYRYIKYRQLQPQSQ